MNSVKRLWWWFGWATNCFISFLFILFFAQNMYKDILLFISKEDVERREEIDVENQIAATSDFPSHLISGLGLLFLFISVAIVIVIIALVIRMRRKHSSEKEYTEDMEKSKKKDGDLDPYMQAIVFPKEPKSQLKKSISKTIKTATDKITGNEHKHKTTIPEELRHQLKHIYVY